MALIARAIWCLALSAGFIDMAQAQSIPAARPLQDPGQQLLDQQRDAARQRALNQPDTPVIAPAANADALNVPATTPVGEINEPGTQFQIDHIEVLGNSVLPTRKIDAIVAPFIGKQLGAQRLSVLLKRLTEAFVEAGYVTSGAFLGPQNLASGHLLITVQVGHIAGYTLNGKAIVPLPPGSTSLGGGLLTDAGTLNVFPGSPGEPLNLADLDQGVAQLNRLQRNQAKVEIVPGEQAGDSIIAIANSPGDSLYFTAGSDNYGSSATGITRTRLGVEAENLFGWQEALNINAITTLDSNAVVGTIAIPFGRYTVSYSVSDSDYQQLIGTTALMYGRTLSHILGLSQTQLRDQSGTLTLNATLTWRRTDREVNDIPLTTQYLAVTRVSESWLHKFTANGAQGYFTLEGGVSQGLSALEASHDASDIARSDAHSQFTKWDMNGSLNLPLPAIGGQNLAYRSSFAAQETTVALYGSEQLYLGGMDSVRGFRSGTLAADRGLWWKNELTWTNAPSWQDGQIEPYVFLDGGKASLIATPGFSSLVGAGAGVRLQGKWQGKTLSGEVMAGRGLIQPAALGPSANLVLATANLNF